MPRRDYISSAVIGASAELARMDAVDQQRYATRACPECHRQRSLGAFCAGPGIEGKRFKLCDRCRCACGERAVVYTMVGSVRVNRCGECANGTARR